MSTTMWAIREMTRKLARAWFHRCSFEVARRWSRRAVGCCMQELVLSRDVANCQSPFWSWCILASTRLLKALYDCSPSTPHLSTTCWLQAWHNVKPVQEEPPWKQDLIDREAVWMATWIYYRKKNLYVAAVRKYPAGISNYTLLRDVADVDVKIETLCIKWSKLGHGFKAAIQRETKRYNSQSRMDVEIFVV